jgi:hypothetical protein
MQSHNEINQNHTNQAQPKQINVLLVGSITNKQSFITQCSALLAYPFSVLAHEDLMDQDPEYYVVNKKFKIYTEDPQPANLDKFSVVIYLANTPDAKIKQEKWEKIRDEKKCIAIDFTSLKVEPEECVNALEYLLETTAQLQGINAIANKAALASQASMSYKQSIFSCLPRDITNIINSKLYLLAMKDIFSNTAKPIYIKLPKMPSQENENTGNKCLTNFKKF